MRISDKYSVRPVKTIECIDWFLNKHYAGRIPNTINAFGLYNGDILIGVISFGMSANNNLNEVIEGYKTLELNRLVVNDGLERNVLSYFVSKSLKKLPKPLIIVSYADTGQGHNGYIYQATNWIYTGKSKGDYEFLKNGIQYHRKNLFDKYGTGSLENAEKKGYQVVKVKPKHRYIYLLANKIDKKIMLKSLDYDTYDYPKGLNSRYDSSYIAVTQNAFNF